MTTETLAPFDPLTAAITAVEGWPETPAPIEAPTASAAPEPGGQVVAKDLLTSTTAATSRRSGRR